MCLQVYWPLCIVIVICLTYFFQTAHFMVVSGICLEQDLFLLFDPYYTIDKVHCVIFSVHLPGSNQRCGALSRYILAYPALFTDVFILKQPKANWYDRKYESASQDLFLVNIYAWIKKKRLLTVKYTHTHSSSMFIYTTQY